MITTPAPILGKVSGELNEQTTDTSAKRLGYFNTAVRHIISLYKWGWARKSGTIALVPDVNSYNLTTLLVDYNVSWGMYYPELADVPLTSVGYDARTFYSSGLYTMTPDNKQLVITTTDAFPTAGVLTLWYYQTHLNVISDTTVLNIPIPEDIEEAIVLYIQYKVHKAKRQRYDERNALLDFKEKIDQLRLQEASNKAKNMPRVIPNVRAYLGLRRRYP